MVADVVLYHPSVAHYLKFVSTTVGRDKLMRTVQYFSRFYAWYLYRTNNPKSVIAPWEAAKKSFGQARKLLRLGKFLEHIKAASIAADAKGGDAVLRYTTIGRQLGYTGYLLLDNLVTLDSTGIRKIESAKRLQREAQKAWFAGLAFSITASLYKLYGQQQRAEAINTKEGEGAVDLKKLTKERQDTLRQLVQDLCDISVPTYALGWNTSLDEGLVGLAGTLSSILGVLSQWKKTA